MIKSWLSKETRRKVWAITTRNLNIGHETTGKLTIEKQAKEIVFVTKQAFSATTHVSMNKTWYIDSRALT